MVCIYYVYMWCIHRSANAPRHAETHRQVHPQSAQNASAALASKFPLPWRRYTSNSPGGWSSRSRGFFLSPRKNTTKKYGFCRNPSQKNMGFACFFCLMGKGLELGEATLTGHEDSITKPVVARIDSGSPWESCRLGILWPGFTRGGSTRFFTEPWPGIANKPFLPSGKLT